MNYLNENAWHLTKSTLLEGLSASKAKIVDMCLENQRAHLLETAGGDVVSTGNIANFQKIVMPMIRRVIPGTIATEVVGVQPMSNSVGVAFSMRYVYKNDATGSEAGSNITANDEAFGNTSSTAPYASKMRRFYSSGVTPSASGGMFGAQGLSNGGAYNPAAGFSLASSPLSGEGGDTIDMESFPGRSMGLQVLRQPIEAKTRKLQAKFSIEAMQDLSSQHGLDLEAEITSVISAQIVHDIDNEIVTDLIRLAGTTETFDMSGTFTGTPHYVGDRHAVLGVLISKVANTIAAKTRRAGGNFVIVSPDIVTVLQSASKSVFAPAVEGSFEGPSNTRLVGTLNNSIKVYSFLFDASFGAVAASSAIPGGATPASQVVIVGYKGSDRETDSGYFYCPYVPLSLTGTVVDPNTYNNHLAVYTRYGKATFTNTSTSLGQSADYYGKIVVNNLVWM